MANKNVRFADVDTVHEAASDVSGASANARNSESGTYYGNNNGFYGDFPSAGFPWFYHQGYYTVPAGRHVAYTSANSFVGLPSYPGFRAYIERDDGPVNLPNIIRIDPTDPRALESFRLGFRESEPRRTNLLSTAGSEQVEPGVAVSRIPEQGSEELLPDPVPRGSESGTSGSNSDPVYSGNTTTVHVSGSIVSNTIEHDNTHHQTSGVEGTETDNDPESGVGDLNPEDGLSENDDDEISHDVSPVVENSPDPDEDTAQTIWIGKDVAYQTPGTSSSTLHNSSSEHDENLETGSPDRSNNIQEPTITPVEANLLFPEVINLSEPSTSATTNRQQTASIVDSLDVDQGGTIMDSFASYSLPVKAEADLQPVADQGTEITSRSVITTVDTVQEMTSRKGESSQETPATVERDRTSVAEFHEPGSSDAEQRRAERLAKWDENRFSRYTQKITLESEESNDYFLPVIPSVVPTSEYPDYLPEPRTNRTRKGSRKTQGKRGKSKRGKSKLDKAYEYAHHISTLEGVAAVEEMYVNESVVREVEEKRKKDRSRRHRESPTRRRDSRSRDRINVREFERNLRDPEQIQESRHKYHKHKGPSTTRIEKYRARSGSRGRRSRSNTDSPFDVVATEGHTISARGEGLSQGYLGKETMFELDTSTFPDKDVTVVVTGPSGKRVPVHVNKRSSNIIEVVYTPKENGPHELEVLYDGRQVGESPYTVNVNKPKVFIRDLQTIAYLGQKGTFKIDASQMRKGTLEIDSDLPVLNYEKLGTNTYRVTFLPRKIGRHDVLVKYNDQVVEGCPFELEVRQGHPEP